MNSIKKIIPHLGVLARPGTCRTPRLGAPLDESGFQVVEDNYKLIHAPPYDQGKLGCCESAGTCRAIALLGYRETGKVWKFDFVKAYRQTVARFYPDRPAEQEGLGLGDTARLAIELGVLPKGTLLRPTPLTIAALCAAARRGPLLVGSWVTDAWLEANLSPAGDLDESKTTARSLLAAMLAGRGHCTIALSTGIEEGAPYAGSENSWGWWAYKSLFFQSFQHLISCAMQESLEIVLPPTGMRGAKLELWADA